MVLQAMYIYHRTYIGYNLNTKLIYSKVEQHFQYSSNGFATRQITVTLLLKFILLPMDP